MVEVLAAEPQWNERCSLCVNVSVHSHTKVEAPGGGKVGSVEVESLLGHEERAVEPESRAQGRGSVGDVGLDRCAVQSWTLVRSEGVSVHSGEAEN